MKTCWALLLALVGVCSAQQVNQDIVPASPGLRLGHSNQRWNGFFRNLDISGTCIINGTPCGSGGGGTSISTFHVANLPPSPPINTLAIVDDANGPSCTIGGSNSSNLCRFNGFQWVLVSGGSGGSSSWATLGGGTSLGQSFFVGNGSTFSAIGSGSISATNIPVTKTAVLNQWIDSYDSVGRTFHSSQPTYSALTGIPLVGEIRTTSNVPWLLMDPSTLSGHNDGLEFSFSNGDLSIFPFGSSPNVQIDIAGKGALGVVNISNLVANGLKVPAIVSACLEADATGAVHGASGGLCGAGGGSVTFPLNAPDGSSTTPEYSFTNDPELGIATTLAGDKPQIRQVVITGAGPGQSVTATISSPINNLSLNAGLRFIISSLPSTPTDLTSLNITAPSRYVVISATATSPTGTITFSTPSTTITPGTYSVTSGFVQTYSGALVGRSFVFNRFDSSTTNPAQSGSIRFAARDAIKARAGQPDDTTMDISHIRGSAAITPSNSPGTPVMTVNGAHSSGSPTLSVARAAGTNWSATAGDTFLIAASNGDSDNQKYTITAAITVTNNANTTLAITPNLKTALNGGELVVTRYIRTQAGEESGLEVPGDTELKGDLTLSSTKPTLIQVKKQSSTPTLNTTYDAGWFLNSSNRFQCKLSTALGGGDCAPLGAGSGYQIIQDEAVALPAETTVNFTGAGVSCVDNPGSTRTDCTIPGGSGVSGSGTTSRVPKFTGSGSIGDSSIDDGLTTANTVTINATGGLNILGSGLAGFFGIKQGTANSTVATQVGYTAPTSVTAYNFVAPGAAGDGFLANANSLNIVTQTFRSMAATSPITITNPNGAAGNPTYACATCGVTGSPLSQFAATTSLQLQGVVSDEIGNGKAVFASAYQGSDVNVLSSGTVAGTGVALCTDALGGATTSNCHVVTSTSPGVGIAHFAGSTQDLTSSAVNLAGGSAEVTGVLPLVNMTQQFVTNAQTSTYQVLAADFASCKTITVASGTFTITLVASGSQPADGQCIDIINYGSGVVTIARSGQNINGAASNQTLGAASASAPVSAHIVSDGTNYKLESMGTGTAAGVTSFTGDAGGIISNLGSSGGVTVTIAGTSGGIPYFNSSTSWATSAAMAANALALGGGAGAAPKTAAGLATDGTSKVTLGVAGTSVGQICFNNATSGQDCILPPTGALGTVNVTLPPATGTMMMTNTNVQASQMPALTGDVTTSAGAIATTIASSVALAGSPTTTTQSAKDNSTKIATTAYVDRPTPLTAGTSVTLSAPRQYFVCTGTCTITVPVPAAGYEFCVMNDDNVATVITLSAIGSSARYENTARTAYGTAGTGTFVSAGAVGDKVCLLGRDSTHYLTASFTGTWTAN